MEEIVNVIGGGYAGTEAALTLAKYGVKVHLFDCCCEDKETVLQTDKSSELLKNEMIALGVNLAPLINNGTKIKENFQEILNKTENLCFFNKKITEISLAEPTIIATGPHTDEALFNQIDEVLGPNKCHHFQPIYPIIDGIENLLIHLGEYYFLPLTKEKVNELCQLVKSFNSSAKNESLEKWVITGREMLRAKMLKPVVLNKVEFACLKFEKVNNGFLISDFRSELNSEQQMKIFNFLFKTNFSVVRFAGQVNCTFLDPSLTVNQFLQCKQKHNIFFAGRILKAEGILEAISTGHFVALNMLAYLKRQKFVLFPKNTILARLIDKLFSKGPFNLNQISVDYDIIKNVDEKLSLKMLKKFKEDFNARNAWHDNLCSKKKW